MTYTLLIFWYGSIAAQLQKVEFWDKAHCVAALNHVEHEMRMHSGRVKAICVKNK